MLRELTASSGASMWAVGSMLFFIAVYVVVAVRAFRTTAADLDAHARMPLDDDQHDEKV
jgi:cbb3-type cytochrome oxidase subunit 3